jgi:urease subunit alpha
MKLIGHEGNPDLPEDVAAALELVHMPTMAAEGPLHDLGAIQIINSDSQGMGRIGETVRRTFQLAHVMKAWRASEAAEGLPEAPPIRGRSAGAADNDRVLRYLAKVTAEPAITHGISDEVGSLLPGRIADVVLWQPGSFGVKPTLVLKAGHPAWGPLGEGNATVELAQPVRYAPHWAALGTAPATVATTFVSHAALDARIRERVGSHRRFAAVSGTRDVRRSSLAANSAVTPVRVDPADGTVRLDDRVLASEPVEELPLGRQFLLG